MTEPDPFEELFGEPLDAAPDKEPDPFDDLFGPEDEAPPNGHDSTIAKVSDGESKEHVRHSPSSAARWFACHGSIIATDGLESKAGLAADEGTAAHWMLEQCLLRDMSAEDFAEANPEVPGQQRQWNTQGEMLDVLAPLVDEYRREAEKRGVTVIPERKLFCHEHLGLPEPLGGTADITIYRARSKELRIEDLKYGKTVIVKAKEGDQYNHQLMIYLYCAYLQHKQDNPKQPINKLALCIRQPRAPKKRDRKSEAYITEEELLAFADDLKAHFMATLDPDAERTPGKKQCFFCPAKKRPDRCPEYQQQGAKELESKGTALWSGDKLLKQISANPKDMSDDDLGVANVYASDMTKWAKLVKAEVERRLKAGGTVAHWKMAHGNSSRHFTDHAQVEMLLAKLVEDGDCDRADVFEPARDEELASVAKVEKALGKDRFDELFSPFVSTLAGKPVVARDTSYKADYNADEANPDSRGGFLAE